MKTKLDLYLAVQAAAAETLPAKPAEADAKIEGLLKPLNLTPEDRARFSQLFYSRRQTMSELKEQPLEPADGAKAAKK